MRRRSRQGVVRLELADTVVGPRELLLRRASPGSMQVFAPEAVPRRASGVFGKEESSASGSGIRR